MAMTSAAVAAPTGLPPRENTAVFAVTATADADTGNVTIAHGLKGTPDQVYITPILNAGVLSQWSETPASRDATNIVLVKNSTQAGSGNASAQIHVYVALPHSITR